MVLLNGRISCEGTPSELVSRINSEDIAEFLGVNTLEGVVKDVSRGVAQVFSEGFGGFINVRGVNGIEKGTKVLVSFRPGDIVILAGPLKTGDLSITEAVVEDVYITKCNIKLVLRLAGGAKVKAEVSRGYVVDFLDRLRPGAAIWVGIPNRCLRVSKF